MGSFVVVWVVRIKTLISSNGCGGSCISSCCSVEVLLLLVVVA